MTKRRIDRVTLQKESLPVDVVVARRYREDVPSDNESAVLDVGSV